MRLFKKILCPLDFSEASKHAFEYAKYFAKTFDSELILMHVAPNYAEAYAALMPDFPTFDAKERGDLLESFNEFTDDWEGRWQKVIRVGTPYLEILRYATEEKFDLIILGARGLSKFERLIVGTTGERVTRRAACPVLTVRPRSGAARIQRILLPTDFSPLSNAVVPMVASLAARFQAEIFLLHVIEMNHHVGTEFEARAQEYFERLQTKLADEWEIPKEFERLETRKFIRHHTGSAGYGISEFARDWDIDLIAMTTHGRTGLSKILMGSVTEKVIKTAECPVLSVRSQISQTKVHN